MSTFLYWKILLTISYTFYAVHGECVAWMWNVWMECLQCAGMVWMKTVKTNRDTVKSFHAHYLVYKATVQRLLLLRHWAIINVIQVSFSNRWVLAEATRLISLQALQWWVSTFLKSGNALFYRSINSDSFPNSFLERTVLFGVNSTLNRDRAVNFQFYMRGNVKGLLVWVQQFN